MREEIDVRATHQFLVELPDNDYFKEEGNEKEMNKVIDFAAKYVLQCYGMKDVKRMVLESPGKTAMDVWTTSDFAYVLAVMEDKMDQWDHLIKLEGEGTTKEDMKKYHKKNQVNMTEDEKEKYTMTPKKFTNMNTKRQFSGDGWSSEGKRFYHTMWSKYKVFAQDKDLWDSLIATWEEYVEETGICKEWRKKDLDQDARSEDRPPTEEDEDVEFFLPGNVGYQEDKPWAREAEGVGEKKGGGEEEIDQDCASVRKGLSHKQMMKCMRTREGESSEDDSDEDIREGLHNQRGRGLNMMRKRVMEDMDPIESD